jgi:UDP-glucose 4-epimerase
MNKVTNKTVLITGGAGNIGSYILDLVMESNPKECIVVDNFFNSDKEYLKRYLNQDNFFCYPIDISSLEELQFVFEKHKIDYIFHCASMLIQDSEKLPRKSINTNIFGTFNIVDLANRYGVKKICYSSSASVYGEPKTLPVEELHPYQHKNFIYGWTKITAEMIFLSNCKCDWVGFRYYNVYSERMRQGAFYTQVFPIFYNSIINGSPVKIYGDGKQTMDLIYAGDIARANMLGLESEVTGEFFNVGTGIETSVADLAGLMMEQLGVKVPIEFISNDTQKVKNRKSGTQKINNLLNFIPETSILKGIEKYVNYQRQNG